MPDISTDITKAAKDIANVAKDATYVVIGAGVLGVQRAQVQRHELMQKLHDPSSELSDRVAGVRGDLTEAVKHVDAKVDELMDRAEELIERVEAVFAPFEEPPAAPGPRHRQAGARAGQGRPDADPQHAPHRRRLSGASRRRRYPPTARRHDR